MNFDDTSPYTARSRGRRREMILKNPRSGERRSARVRPSAIGTDHDPEAARNVAFAGDVVFERRDSAPDALRPVHVSEEADSPLAPAVVSRSRSAGGRIR